MVLGAVALSAKKGGTLHRRSGLLFVCAMIVMGTTASILGFLKSPTDGNVFAGFMTAYFVGTALTTVRPATPWTRGFNVAALIVAVGLGLGDISAGIEAFNSPGHARNGVPFVMLFFIAAVMLLAAFGDVRVMRSGMPRGGPRLARHLWRMCFALFIAADRSSRSASAWRGSSPSRSPRGRCAPCRSCCCSPRCSTGCGGSAAAARCPWSCDTTSAILPYCRLEPAGHRGKA